MLVTIGRMKNAFFKSGHLVSLANTITNYPIFGKLKAPVYQVFTVHSFSITVQQPMNYLAHAYLSFHDPATTVGQMIADFVKGKQVLTFPADIQNGIRAHRELDEFTDKHEATRRAKDIFKPTCGPYGAVFMDVVYDHYLANDPQHFNLLTLGAFAESTYQILQAHHYLLPPFFQQVFTHMRQHNWLYQYHLKDGIYQSFSGIVRRAKYFDQPVNVPFGVFEDNYNILAECYQAFFPDALAFMKEKLPGLQ